MPEYQEGNKQYLGDRLCPECEIVSLVEYGSSKWKCLKCHEVYDEEWLDADIEE